MMERQVAHMVRMVDDLLEVSRISRGKIELRKEPVDLAAVLRNAVETSLPLIEASKHKLTVEVPPSPLLLEADPVRLAQVFANLLNNSAKYTPEGGTIAVSVRVEADMAVVCVKDNGEGIPAQMLSRVVPYVYPGRNRARAQGGIGIGLTLARRWCNFRRHHRGGERGLDAGASSWCGCRSRCTPGGGCHAKSAARRSSAAPARAWWWNAIATRRQFGMCSSTSARKVMVCMTARRRSRR